MTTQLLGPTKFGMTFDSEARREYKISWKIWSNDPKDDPSIIANTSGIPSVGSTWTQIMAAYSFNGADDWAFCRPDMEVEMLDPSEDEPAQLWLVTNTFSTPSSEDKRCQDQKIENPLLEPPQISGSFQKYRELPHQDRDGKPYRSTTAEPLVGQEVERDRTRWEVDIKFNVLNPQLSLVNQLADRLNDSPMWGLPAETVKFSRFRFERLLYGLCTFYFRLDLGFEIREDWTQYLADKGRMELIENGNPTNPDHWKVTKDRFGENKPVLRLDTFGKPITSDSQTPGTIVRKPYPTGNLLALGIPASF